MIDVAGPPEGSEIRYSSTGLYPVGDLLVPAVIEAVFDRPDVSPHRIAIRIEMTFHDRVHPTMTSVAFQRTGDAPVRTSDLRIPLAELEREAILAVAHVVTKRTPSAITARRATPEDGASVASVMSTTRPSGRWQLTPELLAEVVTVYRAGELLGRPVMHVAEHFGRNRPTASRWIQKAREEGYFEDDEDDEFNPDDYAGGGLERIASIEEDYFR